MLTGYETEDLAFYFMFIFVTERHEVQIFHSKETKLEYLISFFKKKATYSCKATTRVTIKKVKFTHYFTLKEAVSSLNVMTKKSHFSIYA